MSVITIRLSSGRHASKTAANRLPGRDLCLGRRSLDRHPQGRAKGTAAKREGACVLIDARGDGQGKTERPRRAVPDVVGALLRQAQQGDAGGAGRRC